MCRSFMCVGRRGRRPLQKTAMHVTNPVGASSRLSTLSNRKTIATGNMRRPPVRCRQRSLCLLEFYYNKFHRLRRGVSSSQKISGATLIFRGSCGLSSIKIKIIFTSPSGSGRRNRATGGKFNKIILICRCGYPFHLRRSLVYVGRRGRRPLQGWHT